MGMNCTAKLSTTSKAIPAIKNFCIKVCSKKRPLKEVFFLSFEENLRKIP